MEHVATMAWALGASGVWDRGTEATVVWFTDMDIEDQPQTGAALVNAASTVALDTPTFRWTQEEQRDWQAEWKASIGPLDAGGFHLVPSWLDDVTTPDGMIRIIQDPGQAFGSGHHATTVMCMELLSERAEPLTGVATVDVGCGTGVLAIGAALLGAAPVTAVDIDAEAVDVARENCVANGVDVRTFTGSAAELLTDGPVPLVLANLVTDTLIQLADDLAALVAPGGTIIVSGIASHRADEPLDALEAHGLVRVSQRNRDGWTAAQLERRP